MALEKLLGGTDEQLISALAEATPVLEELLFEKLQNKCIFTFGVERTMFSVVYPFFERIGLCWLTDFIITAQEHFSSNNVRRTMLVATDQLPPVECKPSPHMYLILPPEGE